MHASSRERFQLHQLILESMTFRNTYCNQFLPNFARIHNNSTFQYYVEPSSSSKRFAQSSFTNGFSNDGLFSRKRCGIRSDSYPPESGRNLIIQKISTFFFIVYHDRHLCSAVIIAFSSHQFSMPFRTSSNGSNAIHTYKYSSSPHPISSMQQRQPPPATATGINRQRNHPASISSIVWTNLQRNVKQLLTFHGKIIYIFDLFCLGRLELDHVDYGPCWTKTNYE